MQTTSPPIVLMPLLLLLLPGPSQRAGSQVPQPVLDRRGLALPLHALLPDTGWVSGVLCWERLALVLLAAGQLVAPWAKLAEADLFAPVSRSDEI